MQRSISLDGGIEIFKHMNPLRSDWSNSSSSWTLYSGENESRILEQCGSFEDVPVSQIKVKSRLASLATQNEGNVLALNVPNSYKGVEAESGNLSRQVKKIQKTFSFKNFLDEVKESDKTTDESLELQEGMQTVKKDKQMERPSGQKSTGPTQKLYYEAARNVDTDLRKKVLIKRSMSNIQLKSWEELAENTNNVLSRSLKSLVESKETTFVHRDESDISKDSILDIPGLQRNYETRSNLNNKKLIVPTIVVTDTNFVDNEVSNIDPRDDICVDKLVIGDSIKKRDISVDPFNVIEAESVCNCRICSEDEEDDSKSFLRNKLSKLFMKIVSFIEFGKKLTSWDENNNIREGEMYNCIMHVLKLMFGLWLRHLDHNPQVKVHQ
ncbi:unnamed protein product [Parnassius apollo]|uniref:(apollo) hypothetical protein n=1 Tax=Parnassius apollo TaxID=110799 RepID=A0A8S3XIU3_PARAO|nr:unnamed protein product [Parnassius apollo]